LRWALGARGLRGAAAWLDASVVGVVSPADTVAAPLCGSATVAEPLSGRAAGGALALCFKPSMAAPDCCTERFADGAPPALLPPPVGPEPVVRMTSFTAAAAVERTPEMARAGEEPLAVVVVGGVAAVGVPAVGVPAVGVPGVGGTVVCTIPGALVAIEPAVVTTPVTVSRAAPGLVGAP
jgi:hypothetical protein